MRLALIAPPSPHLANPRAYPPLGLGYLSAYVRREMPEVETKIICLEPGQEVPLGFDVYGFTATSMDYKLVVKAAEKIRAREPKAVCILGGSHATAVGNQGDFGAVVAGEGEVSLVWILEAVQQGHGTKEPYVGPIPTLDSLPFPDRDFGVEFENVTVMASRGCPHRCSFCGTQTMWPGPTRWRSVGNVIEEIKLLKEQGAKSITMIDDTLTANSEWLKEFCKKIKPLDIEWSALVRADHANLDTMRMMYAAGCRSVRIGAESFDPIVLKALNKGTTPKQNEKAARNAHAAGLKTWLLLMVGTPAESRGTILANIAYLASLRGNVDTVHVSTFMPLPGTPIWEHPEKYGIKIVDRDCSHYNRFWWGPDGKENEPWSPIRIQGMTYEEQLNNIRVMRKFVKKMDIQDKECGE